MRGLESSVATVLDHRLDPQARTPLAVGLSGGGDSLALLILVLDWARGRRPVVALTVDHRLNPDSDRWTAQAQAAATRLGAVPLALAWEGPKPKTGLPAAARDARHRLLANATRSAGAEVLLLGHTAGDLTEAAVMRAAGSSVGDPRQWAPSPVWPEGRRVFLLRPLLSVGREALRDFLRARGETWLEDPANDDLKFARARARLSAPSVSPLRGDPPPPQAGEENEARSPPLRSGGGGAARSDVTEGAFLTLPRPALTPTLLSAACLCAAGHDRPPRAAKVIALLERLRGAAPVTATLAGARIQADAETVQLTREIGRNGLPALQLPQNEPIVWDGRYEIAADRPGLTVRPLAGLVARLPADQRAALAQIPVFARPALPAIVDAAHGTVSCPILAEGAGVRVASLVLARLRAACGLVTRENEGGDPARGEMKRGVLSWT